MHQLRVYLKVHIISPLFEFFHRSFAPSRSYERVGITVTHENRRLFVRVIRGDHGLHFVPQEEITRQAEDATQLRGSGQSGQQAHGASLAETAEHDAFGGDPGFDLVFDQGVEDFLRSKDTFVILGAAVQPLEAQNVVPPGHFHAHVGRDGDVGRIGEDEFGFGEFVLRPPLLGKEVPVLQRLDMGISLLCIFRRAYHPAPL